MKKPVLKTAKSGISALLALVLLLSLMSPLTWRAYAAENADVQMVEEGTTTAEETEANVSEDSAEKEAAATESLAAEESKADDTGDAEEEQQKPKKVNPRRNSISKNADLENWNGRYTYGELKRYIDYGGDAWLDDDGTDRVSYEEDTDWYGRVTLHYIGEECSADDAKYEENYGSMDAKLDFDIYVPKGSTLPTIQFRFKTVSYEGGVKFEFTNEASELTELCKSGQVKVGDTQLSYNSNYSYISSASSSEFVKNGSSIYCYASALQEGVNTVTFVNPDGTDITIYVKLTKEDAGWGRYNYTVEEADAPSAAKTYTVKWIGADNNILETDTDVAENTPPSYDSAEPVKASDSSFDYTFAGWSTEQNAASGKKASELDNVTADVTYYAVFTQSARALEELYVRLDGYFESKIVGQQDDVDAVSSASTSGSVNTNKATAKVQFALVPAGTGADNVKDSDWNTWDYFKNGNLLQADGARSKIVIAEEGSGMTGEFNVFSGDVSLRGVPAKAGIYHVSVLLVDDKGRTATSNALEFQVYDGSEKLIDRLTYDHCTQTADGKYMFDNEPWYIKEFGGDNETVTVPKDIKAWYGSHTQLPNIAYGELGETISLSNGEQPPQTLIIPSGCNLTMVNMRVHSGVKIIVEDGAKLTIRQSTMEGIVEVRRGGTFSMDYNDYGGGEFLHGSAINGQLQMKDGSTLENARIVSHTNYSARDDENRRNYDPVVTTEGTVNIKGNVYILGDEAPAGTEGQPALKVGGTLNVPAGSTLAAYGGGSSNLTAYGGSAIVLDNGTIQGAGKLIAVGGYGMNTADGKGGAAVSGNGTIATARAYLEGGSSFNNPAAPVDGAVEIADTTNRKLVNGGTETSSTHWTGTGDSSGTIPNVNQEAYEVSENAHAAVPSGKTAVTASVQWTDGADKHTDEKVTVAVKTRGGDTVQTVEITAGDGWEKSLEGLDKNQSYTVEQAAVDNAGQSVTDNYIIKIARGENQADDVWSEGQKGGIEAGKTYLITYQDGEKTYMLGAQNGTVGKAEWNSLAPKNVPDGFKWVPEKASGNYGWYLMNADEQNCFLSMKQSGLDYFPTLYAKGSNDYYYALVVDDDGSIWNRYYNQNFFVQDGKLSASGDSYTDFTVHEQIDSEKESFVVTIQPKSQQEPQQTSRIEVEIEKPDDLTVTIDKEQLKQVVLTEQERSSTHAEILVRITKADNAEDSALAFSYLEQSNKKLKISAFYDISISKRINNGEWVPVTETAGDLVITFSIPDGLASNDCRFSVLRIHDGAVQMLMDEDSAPNTITFRSKLFSTYAFAYEEPEHKDGKEDSTSSPQDEQRPSTDESDSAKPVQDQRSSVTDQPDPKETTQTERTSTPKDDNSDA